MTTLSVVSPQCPNVPNAEVLDFIKQIRREGASATITLYAIRELKGAGRREVLSIGRDPNFRLLPKQRAG